MKVIDEVLLDTFRNKPRCENCGTPVARAEAHHIFTKGMGGAFRLDIPENIIALCMGCHRRFHNGTIDRAVFVAKVAKRMRKTPDDIEQAVLRMRHQEKPMMQLEIHPIAADFPEVTGERFEEIKESIREFGVNRPVLIWNGKLMDGRTRLRACEELGVKCPTEELKCDEATAMRRAIHENALRRDMSQDERLMSLAKAYLRASPNGGEKRNAVLKKGSESPVVQTLHNGENAGNSHISAPPQTRDELAEQADVSPRKAAHAITVAKLSPEEVQQAVADGEVSVSDAAAVTSLPAEEQKEALAAVKAGKAKTLRKAAKKKKSKFDGAEKDPKPDKEHTIEEQIKAKNAEIESFCRQLMKMTEDCPEDAWLKDLNRREAALQKFKDGCTTLRSAKCVHPCPVCEGGGCRQCRNTGRVPQTTYQQLK